jgi:hypothetical protein
MLRKLKIVEKGKSRSSSELSPAFDNDLGGNALVNQAFFLDSRISICTVVWQNDEKQIWLHSDEFCDHFDVIFLAIAFDTYPVKSENQIKSRFYQEFN